MKRIYKCRWNKKIAGVFGGLGQYLNIDPTILRLLAVLLFIPTGIVVIPALYFLAALVLPEGPKHFIQPKYKRLYRSYHDRKLAGVCGGFGKFFKIDSNIIRIAFLIITIATLGFIGIIAYIICAVIMPLEISN